MLLLKIFELYHSGMSYQKISTLFNKEQVLGKENWRDSSIVAILENEIYKGDFVHSKRTKHPTYMKMLLNLLLVKKCVKNAKFKRKR